MEIDAFVLISCPFGVLLETNDYFKPVVSIFEAEMALNPTKSWAAEAGWSAEFGQILDDQIGEHEEDGRVEVSLVSGNIRVDGGKTAKSDEPDGTDKQIALYSAGDYFKERTWHGLDDSIRIDEELKVTEGRSGIAAGYATEAPSKNES
ncbi:unnamed protein product, partial [Mesorhabditis belari]|uniref:Uncharacterized protein n=1 Tax=Mesorhabditis belari TaxID=2138241 RepID=A0AAF3EWI1_9BILA